MGLLLLQIGFKDYYPYSQVCCATTVLIAFWNVLSIDKKNVTEEDAESNCQNNNSPKKDDVLR